MYNSEEITLDFNETTQEAIIGHMFSDKHFFLKCVTLLESHYFQNIRVSGIFSKISVFFEQFKKQPTVDEIRVEFDRLHPHDIKERKSYHDKIAECLASSKKISKEYLAVNMTGWLKTVKLQMLIVGGADRFNRRVSYDKNIDWIAGCIKDLQNTSFIEEGAVRFSDAVDFFMTRNEEFKDCLTIGNDQLDELLRTGSRIDLQKRNGDAPTNLFKAAQYYTEGGLVKGDATMILGPSNAGKTTTTLSIITPNVMNEKNVLYITHEQKWEDIKSRIFQNILRNTELGLRGKVSNKDPHIIRALEIVGKTLDRYLKYFSYIKTNNMFVEDVVDLILREQESMLASTGRGFDMLVVDYPGKLNARALNNKVTGWEKDNYVYDQFVNLCLEHRFHGILPVQTNREGYKINKSNENKLLDQDSAAGGFGVMQKASNIITLNRNNKDIANQIMKFHIAKSRTSASGYTLVSTTDFKNACTHSFHLPVKTFQPGETISDMVLEMLFNKTKESEQLAELQKTQIKAVNQEIVGEVAEETSIIIDSNQK